MTAKSTRILKEARSLFWPWCAVIIAGALPLLEQPRSVLMHGEPLSGIHRWSEPISFLGFVLGIPLLATLSLGNEFQHRTLPLLLSQPVSRMEIWREKMSVTIVAIVSALLVFSFGWRSELQQHPNLWIIFGAFIIAMVASATFWTLLARSTMGGLALNGVNSFISLAWVNRRDWIPETITARSITAFALLSYAGVMLWLGRRSLARFQATGGPAGDDLLMAGPDLMPGALAEWLRCRSTGPLLNLLRKEFRLLRPVWLISLLGVPMWICLPLFGFTIERGSTPALIMVVAFTPLIAVLAGTMSIGEERTSGTHSWHLTQPVSARRQWFIKLVMAMFTGLVCAVLLPALVLLAGRFIFGSPLMFVDRDRSIVWVLSVALLTFASFWCACAVKGTVHAALWVFPAMIALLLAGASGDRVAGPVVDLIVSRFDLFANFRFTNSVSNTPLFIPGTPAMPILFLLPLFVPTLGLALFQSSRLFRKQLQDSRLFVVRRLLPLAITAFLCSLSLVALYAFVDRAKQQMWTMFRETHEAIEKIQPSTTFDATHPLQFTVEDLAKASPLSERTRRWLRDSRISIASDKPHFGGRYCCGGNSRGMTLRPDQAYSWYVATIQLPSGSVCTISFQSGRASGILGGVCQ